MERRIGGHHALRALASGYYRVHVVIQCIYGCFIFQLGLVGQVQLAMSRSRHPQSSKPPGICFVGLITASKSENGQTGESSRFILRA